MNNSLKQMLQEDFKHKNNDYRESYNDLVEQWINGNKELVIEQLKNMDSLKACSIILDLYYHMEQKDRISLLNTFQNISNNFYNINP